MRRRPPKTNPTLPRYRRVRVDSTHSRAWNGSGYCALAILWRYAERNYLRNNAQGQTFLARLEKTHGQGKALTILAHTLARAVSAMVTRDTVRAIQFSDRGCQSSLKRVKGFCSTWGFA